MPHEGDLKHSNNYRHPNSNHILNDPPVGVVTYSDHSAVDGYNYGEGPGGSGYGSESFWGQNQKISNAAIPAVPVN